MDLFTACSRPSRKKRKEVFEDYEGFVEKFKPKKTTDDCYTPAAVYTAVLDWVRANAAIDGRPIVRPFFPGGDYENFAYPENCVVVDNPPFSIITKIARFYQSKGIAFFLFAPHMTLFSAAAADWTQIIVDVQITYDNGAMVRTAFISNLFDDTRILIVPDLGDRLERLSKRPGSTLPKYEYPENLLTVSRLSRLVRCGRTIAISSRSLHRVSVLDAQRPSGRGVFGGGYICSDAVAAAVKDAEARIPDAVAAAVKDAEARMLENVMIWELSDREREIVKSLE